MSANNGASIYKKQMGDKNWVFVATSRHEGSPLSFFDWYEQIRLLRECEEEKYGTWVPDPLEVPRKFFARCWETPMPSYDELAAEARIPNRGQNIPLPPPPPPEPCPTCNAFTWKACHLLRGVLQDLRPPRGCVALVPEAR